MIVILDTSNPVCRLSTIDASGAERVYDWEAGRTLARDLHARIVAAVGGEIGAVTQIAICRGPGSFTGLRIGITVANTLAESLRVPIVGGFGDTWRTDALERLARGENDMIVMPEYGAEAHITQQKK